ANCSSATAPALPYLRNAGPLHPCSRAICEHSDWAGIPADAARSKFNDARPSKLIFQIFLKTATTSCFADALHTVPIDANKWRNDLQPVLRYSVTIFCF